MFAPGAETPCTSCNSIADSLNGAFPHIVDRVNVAIVARTSIDVFEAWGRGRGWKNLLLLSSRHNSYNADYHAELDEKRQMPILNVFVKRNDAVHHWYATELLYAPCPEGMHPRHVDSIWPIWNMFDLTPEGRGNGDWYPKHEY